MSAAIERVPVQADLGEAEPGVLEDAKSIVDQQLPRFCFSPFLTLPLDNERIKPRIIRPAIITVIRQFVRQERNFEWMKESEAVSQQESLQGREFDYTVRPPGETEGVLTRLFGMSGNIKTGFCFISELLGREPDKRVEDKRLIVNLQQELLPELPKDGPEQMELLEEAFQRVQGLDPVYGEVCARLLESTEQALAYCAHHMAETEGEMEARAGGGAEARGKLMLSNFDRRVCDWLRRPYPRISSKLSYGQMQPAQTSAPAPAVDLAAIVSASTAATIAALKEAGIFRSAEPIAPAESESEEKPAKSRRDPTGKFLPKSE
jgi:hypothetical protein